VLFDLFATLFVFPALVFLGACSIPDRRTARLFEWLGGISYGLYVLQMPLYGYVAHAVDHTVGNRFSGVSLFWGTASVAFVVVFTIIIDKYFDRPVRRVLTLLVRRPPKLNQKLADATSKG
jgi:peptidoglycan/LPS O-acetylase OafA/YrhL